MGNATLQLKQMEYATGSDRALAAVEYEAEVLAKFDAALTYGANVMPVSIAQGTYSKRITAIADAEAEDLPRGAERSGSNQPESEGRDVTLDNNFVIADHYEDGVQNWINHLAAGQYAMKDAHAVAKTIDLRLSACISLGARMTARGSGADQHLGGIVVTAGTDGAVGTAYPRSLAGSRRLQDDVAEIARTWDERNVPDMGRVGYLTPYLMDVLTQDKTLLSSDFQMVNSLLERRVVMVSNIALIQTTNMNQRDWQTYAQPNYANQTINTIPVSADFQKVIAQFMATPDAVGQIMVTGGVQAFGPTEIPDKHSNYFGAKVFQGAAPVRFESCAIMVIK